MTEQPVRKACLITSTLCEMTAKAKRSANVEILQQAVDHAVKNLPALFLAKHISQKLKEQGVTAPNQFAQQFAEHLIKGNTEPFVSTGAAGSPSVSFTIGDSDVEEVRQHLLRFGEEQLPSVFISIARKLSKTIFLDLKARWPDEHSQQAIEIEGFRRRMEDRWGEPLGKLRMLLTMSREWCNSVSIRESKRRRHKDKGLRQLSIRLLARACQVADEIVCLLENGYADGAMARWRTLHEIAVVAAVILQYGNDIVERYIDHQAVESKRSMEKYVESAQKLGYRPLSARAHAKIVTAYEQAIAKYGRSFKSEYGWAAFHLCKDRPTFADLQEAAGRAEMRAHYQMGNDNIHAGVKSMYVRLGLIGGYDGLLAGRSNAGLTEPGQNTAHTLTQLAALVCLNDPVIDDYVIANVLQMLRDEIPRAFSRAETKLRRDARASPDSGERSTRKRV